MEYARTILDIYSKLLGSNHLFYTHSERYVIIAVLEHSLTEICKCRPTSLDLIVAAHIRLLHLPLQDSIFHTLLTDKYPTLLAHANRVHSLVFPSHESFPPIAQPASAPSAFSLSSLSSLFPKSLLWPKKKIEHAPTEQERRFALIRWGFFGAAAVTMGAYMKYAGFFALVANIYVQTLEVLERQQAGLEQGGDYDDEEDEDNETEFIEADLEEVPDEGTAEDDGLDDEA